MARRWLDYKTGAWVQWCPGCGDFGILNAIYGALAELDIDPARLVVVGGIGCSSRSVYYIKGSNVHTVHGRAIPVASGIKLANPELTVIVTGGDGDLLGIGGNHFTALGRRNIDIAIFIYDNAVYGLTKGQAGPTLPLWVKTKALTHPNIQGNVNPLLLAFAAGYTFIARGYAYHVNQLRGLVKAAILHKGSAVVDILQPCPTYNDFMTQEWYEKRIYYLSDEDPSWDPVIRSPEDVKVKAPRILEKMLETGDRIPLGVFLQDLTKETMEERLDKVMPGYLKTPPAKRPIDVKGRIPLHPFRIFKDKLLET
ncbi:MAG: 2-oxoacid:ferredoxin oxidoreductase subunit beta [Thermoprotei archaeon]|nr:2-oxoacid:ferredoxin oxidoreductase subunit beta [Thermoprotei archaeon]